MIINNKDDGKVIIIAEAGVNHNGSLEIARKLAASAKESGADIVKFQTFQVSKLASRKAQMAEYQKENTGIDESQVMMLKKLELTETDFRELASYCDGIGIQFLSTPFDLESIRFLDNLQNIWKIPSGEITDYPYLMEIAKTGKDIILSTGMSTLDEVAYAVETLKKNGSGQISLLHCTTEYPAPYDEINLRAMLTLKEEFKCIVGYSDHTEGMEIPIAAVALGAEIVEKHFTLDRSMEGPDHKASLEPDEFKSMVKSIRNIECALGDGVKNPTKSEIKNIVIARKSIIASRDIKKGEFLTEENITTKRPGNGISANRWNEVLGKKAIKDFMEDELIEI